MIKYFLGCWLVLTSTILSAQVRGKVYSQDTTTTNALFGAKIRLLKSDIKQVTDEEGNFQFVLPKEVPDTMVISARGHYSDTIVLYKEDRFANLQIILYSEQLLPEVVVSIKKDTKSISKLKTLLVEELGEGELRKAACCNLSESFETNASVDVSFTDAVSGAKQIQMMGLNGVYTQIQMENIPYLRGLESAFGLNSIPGTWIHSIQITKGTGTVVNGYESMAGLINLDIKKPNNMERFYFNGYGNSFGRTEANLHGSIPINDKWSTALFVHGSNLSFEIDQNGDRFRDLPMGFNVAGLNRWIYQGDRMEAQLGVTGYFEDKTGGQVGDFGDQVVPQILYRVRNRNQHVDAYAKTGFFFKDKPYKSVGVLYNFKLQESKGFYGFRQIAGSEKRGYVNVIYDDIIGSTIHKTRLGVSGTAVDFKQSQDSLVDDRFELVPGVFGEYTYTGLRLVNVMGVRVDYHNLFGPMVSPRIHTKYTLTENTDLRFTAGRGWRVPNYIFDNISLLATGREWVAPIQTEAEVSWNIGGSIVQEWKMFGRKASIVNDYYYTFFENQLLVDRDILAKAIVFRYSQQPSFSHSFQSELSFSPFNQLDVRLAYKYLEVRAVYDNVLQDKVMVPKHRGFVNFAYRTRNKRWEYDLTGSVFGRSRLPVNVLPDGSLTTVNRSEIFPMVSGQVTHTFKKWELYVGGENLLNYKMKTPIINASNPFSTTFDATRVWAPITGTMIYVGVRFDIEQKEKQ